MGKTGQLCAISQVFPSICTPLPVFKGPTHTSLDEKGRLSMPTRFREGFAAHGNRLTITRHPHGCLLIFTPQAWETFSAQIEVMPIDAHWMKRVFYGYAMDLELDKAGRVTVPPELRAKASMAVGSPLVLLGMGNYIEMWEAQLHQAHEERAMENEIPARFRELAF